MEYKKINELCSTITSNIQINKLQDNEGNYPLYGASGLVKKIDFYKIDKPYISIVKDGAGVGRIDFHEAYSSIVGTMQAFINNENVDLKYLYYAIKNQKLDRMKTGATIPHIYFKDYGNNLVKFYNMEKQQEIVSILDKIDNIIDADKKQLELLDEMVKSRFIEMFKDDLKGKTNRLSDLCEVITKGTTPTTLGFDFVEEGVNFVKIECITETYEFLINKMLHITSECDEKLKRSKLKENDILFSIAGAIGRTAIVSKDILPANTNQALAIIRLRKDSGLNVKFLNEMLHTELITEQVEGKKNGVAQTNLSLTDIGNLNVIVPSMEKQLKFESFVEQIDKSKFILQQQIKSLQELLDKKMDEYFGE